MALYLTIDDAPSRDLPEKLALLAEYDVPALFFCEGRRLESRPGHARDAAAAGHLLGNHTYTHPHATDCSVEAFREEVGRTESLLADVHDRAGVARPARVFRFPYGDRGGDRAPRFQRVLADFEFETPAADAVGGDSEWAAGRDWGWTLSVEDWAIDAVPELRAAVDAALADRTPGTGDVVLFHDAGTAPALLDAFLARLRDAGVEFGDPRSLLAD